MRKLLIFFSCYCLFTLNLNSLVIVVHGSFANKEPWYQPDGDFFSELEKQARMLNHKTIAFCWPGTPTTSTIITSGKNLAQLILSYPPTEQFIVVGHSHGGNVINIASQLLNNAATNTFEANFLLSLTPTTRTLEPCLLSLFCTALMHIKTMFEISGHQWRSPKNYLIQAAYLLGTPIDSTTFMPSMNTIEHVYNFYSEGDLIQPVLGLFERTLPLHERVANFSIMLKNTEQATNPTKPSHSELHNTLVARWLLFIPHELKRQKVGNFEHFDYTNAHITINNDHGPQYTKLGLKKRAAFQQPLSLTKT